MALKKKHKLDTPPPGPKPAYVMPPPNEDAEAYGWMLGKLRLPSKDENGEVWPGRGVFGVPMPLEAMYTYGMDVQFIDTGFVQALLDAEPAIRKGAEKVKEARYTKEALAKFAELVDHVFKEKVIPEIIARFSSRAATVAAFYAARLAHITKFGVDDENPEEGAKKTRRRRKARQQNQAEGKDAGAGQQEEPAE